MHVSSLRLGRGWAWILSRCARPRGLGLSHTMGTPRQSLGQPEDSWTFLRRGASQTLRLGLGRHVDALDTPLLPRKDQAALCSRLQVCVASCASVCAAFCWRNKRAMLVLPGGGSGRFGGKYRNLCCQNCLEGQWEWISNSKRKPLG